MKHKKGIGREGNKKIPRPDAIPIKIPSRREAEKPVKIPVEVPIKRQEEEVSK